MGMKMAKASERDLEMALDLSGMLESFERGYFPLPKGSEDDDAEEFDRDRGEHCRRAMEMILDTLRRGSLFRVTFGMLVVCDPRNEMIDPHLSYLEHHPDTMWARQQRGELLDCLELAMTCVPEVSVKYRVFENARDKEIAYGLLRYLAGGGWLPFTKEVN